MFQAEPATIPLSILMKYGFAKQILLKSWEEEGRPSRTASRPTRAQSLLNVLKTAALHLDGMCDGAEYDVWVANCGGSSSRMLGPGVVLHRLGIVYKNRKRGRRSDQSLRLVKDGKTYYRVLSGAVEQQRALAKLACMVEVGDIFAKYCEKPPRTVKEWSLQVADLGQELDRVRAPFLSGADAYCQRWVIRALLICAMRSKGIQRLRCEGATCRDLSRHCPDVGGWVLRLSRSLNVTAASELMKLLKYRAPVELLSMHLCVANSDKLDVYDFDAVARHVRELTALQVSYRKKFKQDAAPAVLLKAAKEKGII